MKKAVLSALVAVFLLVSPTLSKDGYNYNNFPTSWLETRTAHLLN